MDKQITNMISRLLSKHHQKQNIERGDPIFNDAITLFESLRQQLAKPAVEKQLVDALRGLLQDTQHSEHSCSDTECPVTKAREAIAAYDALQD